MTSRYRCLQHLRVWALGGNPPRETYRSYDLPCMEEGSHVEHKTLDGRTWE